MGCNSKNTASFLYFPAEDTQPGSKNKATADKPQLRDILPNNWFVIFKCQDPDSEGLKETKKT